MGITLSFADDLNAEQVANKLAYWATIMAQGNKVVVAAMLANEEQKKAEAAEAAAAAANDNGTENVIDLAKAAASREAKKKSNGKGKTGAKVEPKVEPKPKDTKLTEAQVRSIMIDYVNVASKVMKEDRKAIFHGVSKVVELPEDKYQAMVDLIEERTLEIEKMVAGE
jgi:hypothetical protein